MGRARVGVIAVVAATIAGVGVAPAKPPAASKLTLVQAQCAATLPALPGPCSPSFAFKRGTAVLKNVREPAPTCPRTGNPEEAKGGEVTLLGVTKGGAAFTGRLPAQVVLKTTFGSDPNGNCALVNVQIETLSLIGMLDCRNGKCRGSLFPIACLPAQCADTPITSELGRFVDMNGQRFGPLVVMDDAGNPLATPGLFLAPSKGDGS